MITRRKVIVGTLALLVVCFCIYIASKNYLNFSLFDRFTFAADIPPMIEQINFDIKELQSIEGNNQAIMQLSERQAIITEKALGILYTEDDFSSIKQLYDDVSSMKERAYGEWYKKIEAILLSVAIKFRELQTYGVHLPYKQEELASVKARLEEAKKSEDFRIAETLASQLDFFLQDQINIKKTIYLQGHLREEIDNMRKLLQEGQLIGIKDEDLEKALEQIAVNSTSSNAEYIAHLERYERVLIDGKLAFQKKVEEKRKALEEEERKKKIAGYIPIKDPTYPIQGKSIEVSIEEQVVRLYEDGMQIRAFFAVTGKKGWETTKGIHKILYKQKNKILSMDYPEFYRIPVKYWMPFTQKGEGIHDATYRTRFGPSAGRSWNGSHGCVNSPLDEARYVYEWAPVGTTVVVY